MALTQGQKNIFINCHKQSVIPYIGLIKPYGMKFAFLNHKFSDLKAFHDLADNINMPDEYPDIPETFDVCLSKIGKKINISDIGKVPFYVSADDSDNIYQIDASREEVERLEDQAWYAGFETIMKGVGYNDFHIDNIA